MKHPPKLPPYDAGSAENWMAVAIAEAGRAAENGEVPVGCVVISPEGEIAGRGRDRRQTPGDPLAHAEVSAIREAAEALGDWRLDGTTLVVTLEPCPMCAGLILMSRVGRVVYGADNWKWGAAGTIVDLLGSEKFPHKPEIVSGVSAEECAAMLTKYFEDQRLRKKAEKSAEDV